MNERAILANAEPYFLTQHDVHAFELTKDPIRCLDIASVNLTSIIQSIFEDILWPHPLSILCTCWLKECSEIHFQQNIIKPIQKSVESYLNKSVLIHSDDDTRDICYIISLYFGQYGFYPFGEHPDDHWSQFVTPIYSYNSRMVKFDRQGLRYTEGVRIPILQNDENILYYAHNNGLWRADIFIKSLSQWSLCQVGITHNKYIHKETVKRWGSGNDIPVSFSSCIVYKTCMSSQHFTQEKEVYLRQRIQEQYDAETQNNDDIKEKTLTTNKGKKKKKKMNKLGASNLGRSLMKKQIQMKHNMQFNYTDYLLNGGIQRQNWGERLAVGSVLKWHPDRLYHVKIEPETDAQCYKIVSEFRKNVSKDFAVWNQHRYVEIFGVGDIITVEVNVKENWCRFYKNGVMQYHVDGLPYSKQSQDHKDKGLWLFMTADVDNCYVFDRKV